MDVQGNRWEFRIGNNHLIVENAWNWVGYSQERVRLNGEVIRQREGWFWFVMSSTIIAQFDHLDVPHAVVLGMSVDASHKDGYLLWSRVMTADAVFEPDSVTQGRWNTQTHLWPPDPDPLP